MLFGVLTKHATSPEVKPPAQVTIGVHLVVSSVVPVNSESKVQSHVVPSATSVCSPPQVGGGMVDVVVVEPVVVVVVVEVVVVVDAVVVVVGAVVVVVEVPTPRPPGPGRTHAPRTTATAEPRANVAERRPTARERGPCRPRFTMRSHPPGNEVHKLQLGMRP